ncbi:MAG: FAD-dependent oxidoreductase [Phycisphaerae bacterium]|nr:FAD-dependent oxidoreductase [Phycisphaerae bacterium]
MNSRRAFLQDTLIGAGGALALNGIAAPTTAAETANVDEPFGDTVDVVVCGGGPAGIAAAVMAARQGAKVLLVERYGRLGGMAVHALVGPLMGGVHSAFVEEVLKRIGGRHPDPDRLDIEYAALGEEAGVHILLHAWVLGAVVEDGCVKSVRLGTKQGFLRVAASVFVDATGDGDVAALAGAAFEMGRPGDGLLQPASIMYRIGGVEPDKAILCGSEEQALEVRTPAGTWHDVVVKAQVDGELPPEIGVVRLYRAHRPGEQIVNATQVNRIDGTRPIDLTRAELEGRRQAYRVLDFLRKHAPGYEHAYIAAMPAVIGVRETRRILGVDYLTREDVVLGRERPDAVVRRADFVIDIHNPTGPGQAEGFARKVKPYDIPYGCLVPRTLDGLLLAGRCISGSHDAHASYRVQCIAMATGAAAGTAAGLAAKEGAKPRDIEPSTIQNAL